MTFFSNEEIALMNFYDYSSLTNLIGSLQIALPHVTDKEAADVTADCIGKLCSMNNEEFEVLRPKLETPEIL